MERISRRCQSTGTPANFPPIAPEPATIVLTYTSATSRLRAIDRTWATPRISAFTNGKIPRTEKYLRRSMPRGTK